MPPKSHLTHTANALDFVGFPTSLLSFLPVTKQLLCPQVTVFLSVPLKHMTSKIPAQDQYHNLPSGEKSKNGQVRAINYCWSPTSA